MKTQIKKTVFTLMNNWYETRAKIGLYKKEYGTFEGNLVDLLGEELLQFLSTRTSTVGIALYDSKTNKTYHLQGNMRFSAASTIKVSVLMAMLKLIEKENREFTEEENSKINNMILNSNNEDTTWLWNKLGKEHFMQEFLVDLGLKDTVVGKNGYWGLTQTTANDQIKLLKYLIQPNEVFNEEKRQYALKIMNKVNRFQNWGVSGGVPSEANISLKNGWIPMKWNNWRINSIGCIISENKRYSLTVLSIDNPTQSYGIKTIEEISSMVWKSL